MPPDLESKIKKKYHIIIFTIICLMGILARHLYLLQAIAYPNFEIPYAGLDAELYHLLGKAFAGGDWTLGDRAIFSSSPLYGYMIGILYAILDVNPLWVRLLNTGAGIITLICIYKITRQAFRSNAIALVAMALAAIYGPFIVFDTSALKTSVGLCLTSFGLLLLIRYLEDPKPLKWIFSGIIWGCAINFNGQLAFFVGFFCLCFFLGMFKSIDPALKKKINTPVFSRFFIILCLLTGIGFSMLPFLVRNYAVTGKITATHTTSGIHFYIANHKGSQGRYHKVPGIRALPAGHVHDARRSAEQESNKKMTDKDVSAFYKNKAITFIRENPGEFLKTCLKRAGFLISSYEIPNNENYHYLVTTSPFLNLFLNYGVLFAMAVAGMILSIRKTNPTVQVLYLFYVTLFLVLITGIVTWRYRIPMVLIYFPFAAFLINTVWQSFKGRKYRQLSKASVLFIFALLMPLSIALPKGMVKKDLIKAKNKMNNSRTESLLWEKVNRYPRGRKGQKKSSPLLQIARHRKNQNDWEGALDILKTAINDGQKSNGVYQTLSLIYYKLGDMDAAQRAKKTALENSGNRKSRWSDRIRNRRRRL